MPQPARLIWANNLHHPAGVTVTGTGLSDPIDLAAVEAVFLSVVVGDLPPGMSDRHAEGPQFAVTFQVCEAGGTWLPAAILEPRYLEYAREPWAAGPFTDCTSVGLGATVPMVLPPTARIRWDAYRWADGSMHPVSFGRTVISLYGR
ncbi:hypothetical protein [Streptomyces sp. NPDC051704]|uniref:hypothetical protein n=1 Tax=Streptomyces sp. NPDC051704 TaxID=3365671 RepID=UPI0037AEF577